MSKSRQAERSSSLAEVSSVLSSGWSSLLLIHRSKRWNGAPFKELSNLSNEVFKNICCRQVAFFKCVRLCSLLSLNLNVEFFVLLLALTRCALKGLWTALSRFLLPGQPQGGWPTFPYGSVPAFGAVGEKKQGRDCYPRGALSFSAAM